MSQYKTKQIKEAINSLLNDLTILTLSLSDFETRKDHLLKMLDKKDKKLIENCPITDYSLTTLKNHLKEMENKVQLGEVFEKLSKEERSKLYNSWLED